MRCTGPGPWQSPESKLPLPPSAGILRSISGLPQVTGLEHKITGIHLAVHLVVTSDQADALDLGAHFKGD
jgi:hypothetical protein